MINAARIAEEEGADFIDINMGCPAPKIVKGKDGAALMKEPELAVSIAKAVVDSVKLPVTVKMRLGWDECRKNAPELAKKLEQIGVRGFTVHGRTKEQGYSGKADWNAISTVKKSVSVPVFGNGDINTPEDALKLIEITNCDGVAVARATMGMPWLSKQISEFLISGEYSDEPSDIEKINLAILHLDELIKIKGENIGIKEARRHLANYTKGMPNSSKIRAEICQINSREEAVNLLTRLKEDLTKVKVLVETAY